MTKSIIQHTPFALVAAAAGILLATSPVASAKKPKVDAAITTAVGTAATTDIEDIVSIGIAQGTAMANKQIKLTTVNVNALTSGLLNSIVGKAPGVIRDGIDVNRTDNKIDEAGETAAYIVGTLATNKKLKKLGFVKNVVSGLLKSALASVSTLGAQAVTDVVGSVAQTLSNAPALSKIETKLQKQLAKSASKIAGANASVYTAALTAGFAGGTVFEDGNLQTLAVADPETDKRNG